MNHRMLWGGDLTPNIQENEASMDLVFMAVILIIFVAALLFIKSLNLSVALTSAIIFFLILLAIYSLARVQPKEINDEKVIKK